MEELGPSAPQAVARRRGRTLGFTMDAEVAKKRQYNREKQREFRKKLEVQVDSLRATVHALERELVTHKAKRYAVEKATSTSMLPWRDVAAAFSSAATSAVHTNRALKAELRQLQLMAHCMHHWVQPHALLTRLPTQTYTNGGQIALYNGIDSRKLGARWITERLRHNADAILHAYGMHIHSSDWLGDMVVARDANDNFEYIVRHQRLRPVPFEVVCHAYDLISRGTAAPDHGVDLIRAGRAELDRELMGSLGEDIVYSQAKLVRNGSIWLDNKLWRTYRSPDRLLVVSQNVQSDPLYPVTPLQRNRFSIVSVDRVADGWTLTRQLNFNSHAFTGDDRTFVPFETETMQYNVDLSHLGDDDEAKRAEWTRIQKDRASRHTYCMEAQVVEALAEAMAALGPLDSHTTTNAS